MNSEAVDFIDVAVFLLIAIATALVNLSAFPQALLMFQVSLFHEGISSSERHLAVMSLLKFYIIVYPFKAGIHLRT